MDISLMIPSLLIRVLSWMPLRLSILIMADCARHWF